MSEAEETTVIAPTESPPATSSPVADVPGSGEAIARLRHLASELIRTQNRRLLIEYLQLRRAMR